MLPSVTEETKGRLEKLILELYKFVNSEGKLLQESRHNAKCVTIQYGAGYFLNWSVDTPKGLKYKIMHKLVNNFFHNVSEL